MFSIFDSAALAVTNFTPLNVPLLLSAWTVNIDALQFIFTYGDLIDLLSVDPTQIVVYALSDGNLNSSYTLTNETTVLMLTRYSYNITLVLSIDDMNTIKYQTPLLHSATTSWVSFSATFAQDSYNYNVANIDSKHPYGVTVYVPNMTPPEASSYTLNMNTLTLILLLSETVNISSIDLAAVSLQSTNAVRFGTSVSLIGSTATIGVGKAGNVLSIVLGSTATTSIKFQRIASTQKSAYLSWTPALIADSAGLAIIPAYDASVLGKPDGHHVPAYTVYK
jgi:hypothetical protein